METAIIIAILLTGALNMACFFIGAKVGMAVAKDEPIEIIKVEPLKAIREHEDRKEAEREQSRFDAIMRNIESYDGTDNGQEDVPRG